MSETEEHPLRKLMAEAKASSNNVYTRIDAQFAVLVDWLAGDAALLEMDAVDLLPQVEMAEMPLPTVVVGVAELTAQDAVVAPSISNTTPVDIVCSVHPDQPWPHMFQPNPPDGPWLPCAGPGKPRVVSNG